MSGSIGSVSVAVVPSAEGFTDALRAQLIPEADELGEEIGQHLRDKIEEALQGIEFGVQADTEEAVANLDDVQARADDLKANPTEVTVTANTESAVAGLQEVGDAAADANASEAELREQTDRLVGSQESLAGTVGNVDQALASEDASAAALSGTLEASGRAMASARENAEDLAAANSEVTATALAASGAADAEAESYAHLREEAEEAAAGVTAASAANEAAAASSGAGVGEGGITIPGAEKAEATLAELREQIEHLDETRYQLSLGMDDETAEAALGSIGAQIDELEARHLELTIGVDDGDAEASTAALAGEISDLQGRMDELTAAAEAAGGSFGELVAREGELIAVSAAAQERLNAVSDASLEAAGKEAAAAKIVQTAAKETEGEGGGGEGGGGGLMAGLLAAALALGPAFIAAAAGEAIFAGAAIPDIDHLIHNTGAFKTDITQIKAEYTDLSDAVKPEVFSDFDVALTQAKAILPEFTADAKAGGQALGGFLDQFGNFVQSGDTKQFLAFVQGAVGPDVHAFANLFQGGATAVEGFAESLNGISKVLINVVGGVLSFGGEVLKEVPWIGQWAVGIGVAYFALEKLPGMIAKLIASDFITWLIGGEEATAAITAAFIAEDGAVDVLAGSLAILDAINPFVWAVAGTVAIGALTAVLVRSQESVGDVTEALQKQYDATGYNVQGWDDYAKALSTNAAAQREVGGAYATTFEQMHDGISVTQSVADVSEQASAQATNLTDRLNSLSGIFGVSRTGAIQLAEGAKVTAAQLASTGEEGQKAYQKVLNYAEAGATASSKTTQFAADMADAANKALSLTTRVTDLTTALKNESDDTDTTIGSMVTYHQSLTTLEADMVASGDKAGYLTKAQQTTAQAIASADSAAKAASAAFVQQGDSVQKAAGPLEALRGELEKIQDPTQAEKELIHELGEEIAALKSKRITLTVQVAEEGGSIVQAASEAGYHPGTGLRVAGSTPTFATGGKIPGYGGGDTYGPIMVERGETIVPKHLTPRFAPQFAAAGIPGFAAGGLPGGISGSMFGNTEFDFQLFMNIAGGAGAGSGTQSGVDDADRLAQEFSDGTLKTVTEIRDAGTQAIDALKDYYTGPHAAELERALNGQTTALEDLARQSASIATEIKNMKAYASQETQSLQSFSALSNITGGTDANGNPLPVTGSEIQAGLKQDLAQLKQFFNLIGRLKKAKVAVSLIQQVIAMGPADGITYAEAILSGGEALIKEINDEERSINYEEKQLGDRAAEIKYGQSISKGFLSGLEKDKSKLDKEMARLGDEIAKELKKALGAIGVKTASSTDVSASASSDVVSSSDSSVGGTTSSAGYITNSDVARIVSGLTQIDDREKTLLTKAQGTEIIALLKAAPKATGAAAGSSLADALDSASSKASLKARTRVR